MIRFSEKLFYSRFKEYRTEEIPYNYKADYINKEDQELRQKYGPDFLRAAEEKYEEDLEDAAYDWYYNSPSLSAPTKEKDRKEWAQKHLAAKKIREEKESIAKKNYEAAVAEKEAFDREYDSKYLDVIKAEKDLKNSGYKYRVNTGLADTLAKRHGNLDAEKTKKIILGRKELLDKYMERDQFINGKREFDDSESRPNRLERYGRMISDTATGAKRQWEDAGVVYDATTDRSLNKDAAMVGAGIAAAGLTGYALRKHLKKKKARKEAEKKFKTSDKKEKNFSIFSQKNFININVNSESLENSTQDISSALRDTNDKIGNLGGNLGNIGDNLGNLGDNLENVGKSVGLGIGALGAGIALSGLARGGASIRAARIKAKSRDEEVNNKFKTSDSDKKEKKNKKKREKN